MMVVVMNDIMARGEGVSSSETKKWTIFLYFFLFDSIEQGQISVRILPTFHPLNRLCTYHP